MKNLLEDENFNEDLFDILTNSNGLLESVYKEGDKYKYQLSGYYKESEINVDDLLNRLYGYLHLHYL